VLATLIRPGSSVLEFGAGRMVLKTSLPPGCRYTPSDLVDRGGDTWICDLNAKELPAFPRHDVAVFGGVLEYVHDLDRLARHLSSSIETVVASYATTDRCPRNRRTQGWMNDLSSKQLTRLFENAGYVLETADRWRDQEIFRFVSRKPRPSPCA